MIEKKKILFVSQEISPFLPKSEVATTSRRLPQNIQDSGKEIRIFAPKFGTVNERRHQLHEVIRLSGMNITIDDKDHPLIIKVATISQARMQVYFIDNDEFFRRKTNILDENNVEFRDNDERSIFFCRGVIETVKKLGWQPDIIHCHGWLTLPMGLYLKKNYHKDPRFVDTKVIYSLYNSGFNDDWDTRFNEKLKFDGFDKETVSRFNKTDYYSLVENMLKYFDGVNVGSENLKPELRNIFENLSCYKQDFTSEENQSKIISEFFDRIINDVLV
jgi:starch synthase